MDNLEIPLGKRTRLYRFFEMVPAMLSYGGILLLVVLSIVSPFLAAIYLLLVIITMLVKAVGIAVHTIGGRSKLSEASKVDWAARLRDLENPVDAYRVLETRQSKEFGWRDHVENLRLVSNDTADVFPKPSQIFNAVIIATYNESYEVLAPTLQSLLDTSYDKQRLIVVIAYEARGGAAIEKTVKRLKREFGSQFFAFELVKHPDNLPDEVVGKGGNITHAGRYLQQWVPEHGIEYNDVIITTLDSDNRPHKSYFDYVTYEYIVREDRKHLSYQPISLFLNNIWDAPAPIAAGIAQRV